MTINTERLKTDAAHWDECGAPEDATHYCPVSKLFYDDNYPIAPCCITRPTKSAAPECKGLGIPPVGKEVEYEALHDWWPVKITAVGEKHILMNYGGVEICRCIQDSRFRPIRAKEQRQRDEFVKMVCDIAAENCLPTVEKVAEKVFDDYISRYTLEPNP